MKILIQVTKYKLQNKLTEIMNMMKLMKADVASSSHTGYVGNGGIGLMKKLEKGNS